MLWRPLISSTILMIPQTFFNITTNVTLLSLVSNFINRFLSTKWKRKLSLNAYSVKRSQNWSNWRIHGSMRSNTKLFETATRILYLKRRTLESMPRARLSSKWPSDPNDRSLYSVRLYSPMIGLRGLNRLRHLFLVVSRRYSGEFQEILVLRSMLLSCINKTI
jgi:hypothetical protein